MVRDNAGDRGPVAELMVPIQDRYLLLIRENYLEDPAGEEVRSLLGTTFTALAKDGRLEAVYHLACSDDWREAVVGLHYAIFAACWPSELAHRMLTPDQRQDAADLLHSVGDRYEEKLLTLPPFVGSLPARPAILLMALQRRWPVITAFLDSDRAECDSADVFAAALAAECLTRQGGDFLTDRAGGAHSSEHVFMLRRKVRKLFRREEWYDEQEFARSELRFLQAWYFWTGWHSPAPQVSEHRG